MTCELVKVKSPKGFSIEFDLDQPFEESNFLATLKNFGDVEVRSRKTIFASVAPAGTIEELITNHGNFCLSSQFEDSDSGVLIYSDNRTLMDRIWKCLTDSPDFQYVSTRVTGAP